MREGPTKWLLAWTSLPRLDVLAVGCCCPGEAVGEEPIMTTQQDVDIEGYVEYALGMAIFLTRLFTRVMLVGFRGLHWDDLFTVIAIVR